MLCVLECFSHIFHVLFSLKVQWAFFFFIASNRMRFGQCYLRQDLKWHTLQEYFSQKWKLWHYLLTIMLLKTFMLLFFSVECFWRIFMLLFWLIHDHGVQVSKKDKDNKRLHQHNSRLNYKSSETSWFLCVRLKVLVSLYQSSQTKSVHL